jgi:hypothetical protein
VLDLDQGPANQVEDLRLLAVQFDAESYQQDPVFSSPQAWPGPAEAVSPAQDAGLGQDGQAKAGEAQADPFELTPFEVDSRQPANAHSTGASDLGLGDASPNLPQGFGDDPQGMILDLDAPEVTLPTRDDQQEMTMALLLISRQTFQPVRA